MTTTKTSLKGGDLVSQGSYGCVFKPSYECNADQNELTPKSSSNTPIISKVFRDKKSYSTEMKIAQFIHSIDPNHKWSLPVYTGCRTHVEDTDLDRDECKFMRKNPKATDFYQIQMEYGGISLRQFIKSHPPPLTEQQFRSILVTLLSAVADLQKHNVIHCDIKPGNILLRKTNNKLQTYLIDFGLLRHTRSMYSPTSRSRIEYSYPWYPPEFFLYKHMYLSNDSEPLTLSTIYQEMQSRLSRYLPDKYIKQISQEATSFYESSPMKNVFKDYTHAIDTYSIGITTLEAYLTIVKRPTSQTIVVLQQLCHGDPRKRQTIQKALARLTQK